MRAAILAGAFICRGRFAAQACSAGTAAGLQANLAHNGFFLIVNVELRRRRRRVFVLVYNALINDSMLSHQDFMLTAVLDVFETIPLHLLGEIVYHLDQALIPGGLYDDIVQSYVSLGDFLGGPRGYALLEMAAGFL